MASAKAKYFTDGSYEQVMLAKTQRTANRHGHSPFSKDSYLSTSEQQVPAGAYTQHEEPLLQQEDISITSPLEDEASNETTANPAPTGGLAGPGSDHSSANSSASEEDSGAN